jgi:hypothetical protein
MMCPKCSGPLAAVNPRGDDLSGLRLDLAPHDRAAGRHQPRAEEPREPVGAAAHHVAVIPGEERTRERGEHVPLVQDR